LREGELGALVADFEGELAEVSDFSEEAGVEGGALWGAEGGEGRGCGEAGEESLGEVDEVAGVCDDAECGGGALVGEDCGVS
jgi:hypothetical protein